MKYGRNFGLLMLIGAFVFAAAGNAARGVSGESGLFGIVGAARVLEILAPEFLSTISSLVKNYLHPFIWDPILLSILAFPGWLILGLPGAVLLWKNRKIPIGGEATNDELAYNTYEDVLAAAKEADFENPTRSSRYQSLQEYDPLSPPDDGVQYEAYADLPTEASDLADFRNELTIMPNDAEKSHSEQIMEISNNEKPINPPVELGSNLDTESKLVIDDDSDK